MLGLVAEPLARRQHALEIGDDLIAVFRMAQCAQPLDRDGFVGRLETEDAEELRRGAHGAHRHVHVPDADAGGAFGEREDILALAQLPLDAPPGIRRRRRGGARLKRSPVLRQSAPPKA